MASLDSTSKKKPVAPPQAPAPAPVDSRPDSFQDSIEELGHRAGDYLKGLATWRLVETKTADAGEPDPILTSLKKITTWGLTEDPREGPFSPPRAEDPLVERVHQAGDYLNSLDLFRPGAALVEQQRQAGDYFNRLGAVLKDAASWRSSTFKGLVSWRLDEGAETARSDDSIRGSLQGFVDLGRQASEFLKGKSSGQAAEAAAEEAPSDPNSLAASLKDLATWRLSLKELATWRVAEAKDAEEGAPEANLEKTFADLAHQTGDYLKGLATWRVTEADSAESSAEPVAAETAKPSVDLDLLTAAFSRKDFPRQ